MPVLPTIQSPADLKKLPVDRLPELAGEIRQAICDQVALSGGHLAPNLGVVELTIALHYVFDFGHDRLLFDVGHQCYPHKLITGRQGLLGGLRTRQGMAGFPEPRESSFDLFSVGHAGTGISTAVGMARGDALNGEAYDPKAKPDGRRVVTLIGDASIVNGVAMEGLNNAGTLKRQFLVVLNDNGMSIAKPQGAVAAYFDPEGFIAFVNSWSHGIDLNLIRSEKAWTVGDFLVGLVAVSLTGFVSGAIFAACYNLIAPRARGAKPLA